jgi:hypothetical protein
MTERTIFNTVADVDSETEAGGFADSHILMELRKMITELLTDCTDAKTTGNSGCGCGSADVEFDLDGVVFNVSISLSGDEDVEY